MAPKKDTAHRPSQANQEFVTTADGRRVRNTAYTGKSSAGKRSAPATPSVAKSATEPVADSEKLFNALDNMQHGSIEWDPADLIDSDSVVVSNNGNVVSAPLIRPKIAETSTGIEYRIEAVHVISGKPAQRGLKQHLTETFSKMRNNETDRYSSPAVSEGRFKQLVVTDDGEFFVDGKRGSERLRPDTYVTGVVTPLDSDYEREGDGVYTGAWIVKTNADSKTEGPNAEERMMADVFVKAWKEVAASR